MSSLFSYSKFGGKKKKNHFYILSIYFFNYTFQYAIYYFSTLFKHYFFIILSYLNIIMSWNE